MHKVYQFQKLAADKSSFFPEENSPQRRDLVFRNDTKAPCPRIHTPAQIQTHADIGFTRLYACNFALPTVSYNCTHTKPP